MDNKENAPQFAVFDGSQEITEEMYKEVLDFAAFAQSKDKQ